MPRPAGVSPLGAPQGLGVATSALKFDAGLRNHLLDQIEAFIGTSPLLRVYSGAVPDSIADPIVGTLLAEIACPSDWMAGATGGVKELAGSWTAAATASGQQSFFRMVDSGGTARIQGTASGTGGGGNLQLDSVTITSGQTVAVTVFSLTGGNA